MYHYEKLLKGVCFTAMAAKVLMRFFEIRCGDPNKIERT